MQPSCLSSSSSRSSSLSAKQFSISHTWRRQFLPNLELCLINIVTTSVGIDVSRKMLFGLLCLGDPGGLKMPLGAPLIFLLASWKNMSGALSLCVSFDTTGLPVRSSLYSFPSSPTTSPSFSSLSLLAKQVNTSPLPSVTSSSNTCLNVIVMNRKIFKR